MNGARRGVIPRHRGLMFIFPLPSRVPAKPTKHNWHYIIIILRYIASTKRAPTVHIHGHHEPVQASLEGTHKKDITYTTCRSSSCGRGGCSGFVYVGWKESSVRKKNKELPSCKERTMTMSFRVVAVRLLTLSARIFCVFMFL